MKLLSVFLLQFLICYSVNSQSWTVLSSTNTANSKNFPISISLNSMCIVPSGEIFVSANSDPSNENIFFPGGNNYISQWSGTDWNRLGGTVSGIALNANSWINSICSDSIGHIYAGGLFSNNVYEWDGTLWKILGGTTPGMTLNNNGIVVSICLDPKGNVYVGGFLNISGGPSYLSKWDGKIWSEVELTIPGFSMGANSIYSNSLGDIFVDIKDSSETYLGKWNGFEWSVLGGTTSGTGFNGGIESICSDAFGNIFVAGKFTDANGNHYVAKWDGNSWSELGGTVPGIALNANGWINSICSDPIGNIFAAGEFSDALGKYYVAKWDGNSWSELGGTVPGIALIANNYINSIISGTSGNIYAAGYFTDDNGNNYVAKYQTKNRILNISPTNVEFNHMSVYPNPTDGNIILNVQDYGQVNIYNSLGELVINKSIGSGESTIFMDNLSEGVYSICFFAENSKNYPHLKIVKK